VTPERPRHPTLALIWMFASITFGVALVLLGIAGLFLPILPGVVMILAGLAVLSAHSRRAKALMTWLKEKLHIHQRERSEEPADDTDSARQDPASDDRQARM